MFVPRLAISNDRENWSELLRCSTGSESIIAKGNSRKNGGKPKKLWFLPQRVMRFAIFRKWKQKIKSYNDLYCISSVGSQSINWYVIVSKIEFCDGFHLFCVLLVLVRILIFSGKRLSSNENTKTPCISHTPTSTNHSTLVPTCTMKKINNFSFLHAHHALKEVHNKIDNKERIKWMT